MPEQIDHVYIRRLFQAKTDGSISQDESAVLDALARDNAEVRELWKAAYGTDYIPQKEIVDDTVAAFALHPTGKSTTERVDRIIVVIICIVILVAAVFAAC